MRADGNPGAPSGPPRAAKRPHHSVVHGHRRDDPYAWLRDDDWRAVMRDPTRLDPDIRQYLEADNAWLEHVMADTATLQERLFEEMKARIKEDDSTVPAPDGPFAYFVQYVTGGQHPRICRRPRRAEDSDTVEVLLDGDRLAEGHDYFRLGGASHSPDHRLLAYAADDTGSEYFTVRIKDLESGEELPEHITDTAGSVVWAADGRTLFYSRLDDNHRPTRIFRHEAGADPQDDVLVYEEPDPGFFASVGKTQSGDYIVISTHDHETTELYLVDARHPQQAPRLVARRERGHEYDLDHQGDRFLILTNRDGAEDFRVVEAPVTATTPENWREVVPHVPGRLILSLTAYKDFFVRLEREDGLPRIVITAGSGAEHAISFEEEAYSLGLIDGYEYETTDIRFTYSSMTTPSQVYDYNVVTRERVLRKTQEVPSGHDPADYVTRRVHAPAHDRELVPVSLLYRKDTPIDGTAPLLLYGYGAYGIAIPASFSTERLSLVDRGFVYAIAHVRGGKDKGYGWYKAGKREHKMNTFRDFIAAGEHLAAQGFTSRGRIIAHGGSAGGMLMGAVANMAPDLFLGIIAEVPFVDVLNTMLDASLPLTPPEWPEWGNPIESADDYATIAAYSPYDNVRAQDYPHILALAGLTDPRVTYWEPAKWVARLRELKTDDNLLVLRTNMGAGHSGMPGRFDRLREVALAYAFALKIAGRGNGDGSPARQP